LLVWAWLGLWDNRGFSWEWCNWYIGLGLLIATVLSWGLGNFDRFVGLGEWSNRDISLWLLEVTVLAGLLIATVLGRGRGLENWG
jgi:hypothetical protein